MSLHGLFPDVATTSNRKVLFFSFSDIPINNDVVNVMTLSISRCRTFSFAGSIDLFLPISARQFSRNYDTRTKKNYVLFVMV